MLTTLLILLLLILLYLKVKPSQNINNYYSRKTVNPSHGYKNAPKPPWVAKEVLKLKALSNEGCRSVTYMFNRRYSDSRNMTVSKTYVAYTIKKQQYEIQVLRRKIKHKRPRNIPINKIWTMDLTFLTNRSKSQIAILGIIDHQSRLSLKLSQLQTKSTINILRTLFDAIELFGKPVSIRTDNESMFVSRLFRLSCWLLGIKHQKSDKGCPWQNGRIERFFGTFKSKLKLLPESIDFDIARLLTEYRCWYNHLRPHDYLDGSTPAEVFTRKEKSSAKYKLMTFWKGTLVGDYYSPT